jgi:hypothetical protein
MSIDANSGHNMKMTEGNSYYADWISESEAPGLAPGHLVPSLDGGDGAAWVGGPG